MNNDCSLILSNILHQTFLTKKYKKMNKNIFNIKPSILRIGFFAVAFSLSVGMSAQSDDSTDGAGNEVEQTKSVKKAKTPQYKLVEIKGNVFDAATKKGVAGARVQALSNDPDIVFHYSATTDENGAYTIRVPEFVTVLYVKSPEHNAAQLPLKGVENQDVYLYFGLNKEFYRETTDLLAKGRMDVKLSSAVTIEDDIENSLNGMVRTVNRGGMPAQGAVMFVNGLNSLNANAQPLIVVDGIVQDNQYNRTALHDGFYNNPLNMYDPEDIESVEVLKNGTALYGAKGSNGVIFINTRRGHSQVTKINVRAYGGFETVPSLTKMMDGNQFRNYVTEFLGTTDKRDLLASDYEVPFLNENPYKAIVNGVEKTINPYYNMYHHNTDWQKDLYHTAFTQNYKVSVEGGDDIAMYNLSLGYTESEATAKKNDFNRLNIRFNTDINMFRKVTAEFDIAYSRGAYNMRDNGWGQDYSRRNISSPNVLGLLQSPFVSPYLNYIYFDSSTNDLATVASNSVYSGKNFMDSDNPLLYANKFGYPGVANPYWILQNGEGDNKNYQEQTQFAITLAPRYQISRNFSLSDRFSYIINRTNEKYYLPINGVPSKTVEGLGQVQSVISSQFSKQTTIYNDFTADFRKQFHSHFLNVMGGLRIASYDFTNSRITGYTNSEKGNDKMPNMSNELEYKTYGGNQDRWTNLTWYANADYNFRNVYFLNVTAAMESSSRFGDKADGGLELAGVRWAFFPSVQAGWLMSSEKWFNVSGIDYLKFIVGYDISGNDDVYYYSSRTYFENFKFMDNATGLKLGNIANPKVKWETTRRVNLGFQTSMLKNRLQVGFNYYFSRTSDLITRRAVSDIIGLPYIWSNDGSLKNNGFDLTVDGLLINTKDFKWQAGFSIGHYKNEITKLPESANNRIVNYGLDATGQRDLSLMEVINGYTSSVYGTDNILTAVGQPVGVFYGYQTNGVFSTTAEASTATPVGDGYLRYPTGLAEAGRSYQHFQAGDVRFVDQNGDGWINEADRVVIGDPNPDIYGNLFTSFTWKNFKLDLNFKYSLGNDVFNYQRSMLESESDVWGTIANQTTAVVNRWRYEGQKTDVPRVMSKSSSEWVNNERFSDRWIEDGSYLKLKKIRLTYSLPLRLSWLKGITVWGEANNVFTITKYLGSDPEFTVGNGVLYQGIDAGLLPSNRNFNFGLTVNL